MWLGPFKQGPSIWHRGNFEECIVYNQQLAIIFSDGLKIFKPVERRQGHFRPANSSEVQEMELTHFNTHPRRSIRRAERDLSIPRSTIHVILRRRIRVSPYELRILQELEARDYVARRAFAARCLQNLKSDEKFMSRIIFSDECLFHVSRKVRKHNDQIWGTMRPDGIREHQVYSPKATVWCILSKNQVVGLYYVYSSTLNGSSWTYWAITSY